MLWNVFRWEIGGNGWNHYLGVKGIDSEGQSHCGKSDMFYILAGGHTAVCIYMCRQVCIQFNGGKICTALYASYASIRFCLHGKRGEDGWPRQQGAQDRVALHRHPHGSENQQVFTSSGMYGAARTQACYYVASERRSWDTSASLWPSCNLLSHPQQKQDPPH